MAFSSFIETEARQELDDSATWYEQQSKGLGNRFIDFFLTACRIISCYPGRIQASRNENISIFGCL